jgi:hypothetical protein
VPTLGGFGWHVFATGVTWRLGPLERHDIGGVLAVEEIGPRLHHLAAALAARL